MYLSRVKKRRGDRQEAAAVKEKRFTYRGRSVNVRYQFRTGEIVIVVFQQELPGFLIQRRFGVRVDQQTLDRHEYMSNPKGRLPILLQSVDANLAGGRHVWVEDLGGEPTYGGGVQPAVRVGGISGNYTLAVQQEIRW